MSTWIMGGKLSDIKQKNEPVQLLAIAYKSFSSYVMAAISVYRNNEMAYFWGYFFLVLEFYECLSNVSHIYHTKLRTNNAIFIYQYIYKVNKWKVLYWPSYVW